MMSANSTLVVEHEDNTLTWAKCAKYFKYSFIFLLKALLIFGFCIVIGSLSALGLYVMAPIMWAVLASFAIAALVEGLGVGSSYLNRFFDNLLDPGRYKRQLLAELLFEQNGSQLDEPSQKFVDYYKRVNDKITEFEGYLKNYYGSKELKQRLARLKAHRREIEQKIIAQIEAEQPQCQLENPCFKLSNHLTFTWSKDNVNKIKARIQKVKRANKFALCSALLAGVGFGFGAAAALGLASTIHSAIFYQLFAFIGLGALVSALGPIGLAILVGLGALAYAIMVYQSVLDMVQNPFILRKWREFKACWRGTNEYSGKKRVWIICRDLFLFLLVTGLTILTAGSFWWPAKYLGPVIMGLFSIGSWAYKFNAAVQTIEVLKGKAGNPFKKAWVEIKKSFFDTCAAIKAAWNSENFFDGYNIFKLLEFCNVFRLAKYTTIAIAAKLLFWTHFIPVAVIGDRFAGCAISKAGHAGMSVAYGSSDFFEDVGPYWCRNNSDNDGDDDEEDLIIERYIWWLLTPLNLCDFLWRLTMRSLSWLFYGCNRGNYLSEVLYDSYYLAFYGKNLIHNDSERALEKGFNQLHRMNPFNVLNSPSNSKPQLENSNVQQRHAMTIKIPKSSLSSNNGSIDNLTVTFTNSIPKDSEFTPT